MAGVGLGAAVALEQGDPDAFALQQPRGGDAGEAAADDDDVDVEVARHRRKFREGLGELPERSGFHNSLVKFKPGELGWTTGVSTLVGGPDALILVLGNRTKVGSSRLQ